MVVGSDVHTIILPYLDTPRVINLEFHDGRVAFAQLAVGLPALGQMLKEYPSVSFQSEPWSPLVLRM